MKKTKFYNLKIDRLTESDFPDLIDIEQKIYFNEDPKIIQGESLIKDIKEQDGLKYSVILSGEKKEGGREIIGYIVAIDEKKDKDELFICLEDFAIIPEAQRQGLGWQIMEQFIKKLKTNINKKDESIFIYMYLRENSKAFMNKHQKYLKEIGMELVKETVITDYYNAGQDALYQLYELKIKN